MTKATRIAGLLALALAGCGGDSGTYNCDLSATFAKTCVSFMWTGGKPDNMYCNGGPVVAECPMTGIIGTCTTQAMVNNIRVTQVAYYYTGAPGYSEAACRSAGGTWNK